MPKGTPTIQPAKTVEYETPKELFDQSWDEVGGFDMDPFCRPHHYTARKVIENGGTICVPVGGIPDSLQDSPARPRILEDGLAHPWSGKVWLQPPYGPFLREAVPYAVNQLECGNAELVMALLPSKTEVRWFQEYVVQRAQTQRGPFPANYHVVLHQHPLVVAVRFLKGRLHFGGGDGPARVGSIIVVWRT